jgi:hypothetical protein
MNKTAREERMKWLIAQARRAVKAGVTESRKRELRRLQQRRERVYDLLLAPDVSEPKIFDAESRKAVQQAIFCAFGCDDALKSCRRAKTPWGRKSAMLDVCVSVRASTADQELFTLTAKFIPGVRMKARKSSSTHGLIREHTALVKELEARTTCEERRVSVLLDLVQVEQLLLGFWWGS